jgi:hypothetical protein
MNNEECSLEVAVHRLYDWQHGGTSFSSLLFTLLQKADSDNQMRLGKAFPMQFIAWTTWKMAPSQKEFFLRWGLKAEDELL